MPVLFEIVSNMILTLTTLFGYFKNASTWAASRGETCNGIRGFCTSDCVDFGVFYSNRSSRIPNTVSPPVDNCGTEVGDWCEADCAPGSFGVNTGNGGAYDCTASSSNLTEPSLWVAREGDRVCAKGMFVEALAKHSRNASRFVVTAIFCVTV